MVVRLNEIQTIGELYKKGTLQAAGEAKYPFDPRLLERIALFQGDIAILELDSIVNAANSSLLGGGGVDGVIHRAAGRKLLDECRTLDGCDTGDAKITKGYNLPSKHVIHAVGPVYSSRNVEIKARQLASCYERSLTLATENSLKHTAFPSISTGIYGYPIVAATHIALDEVRRFMDTESGSKLERVVFVVWSDRDKEVYEHLIPIYFPGTESAPVEPQSVDSKAGGFEGVKVAVADSADSGGVGAETEMKKTPSSTASEKESV